MPTKKHAGSSKFMYRRDGNLTDSRVRRDSIRDVIVMKIMAADYPLHESVYKDDVRRVSMLLRTHDVAQKDRHGEFCIHVDCKQCLRETDRKIIGNQSCIGFLIESLTQCQCSVPQLIVNIDNTRPGTA